MASRRRIVDVGFGDGIPTLDDIRETVAALLVGTAAPTRPRVYCYGGPGAGLPPTQPLEVAGPRPRKRRALTPADVALLAAPPIVAPQSWRDWAAASPPLVAPPETPAPFVIRIGFGGWTITGTNPDDEAFWRAKLAEYEREHGFVTAAAVLGSRKPGE